MPIQFFLLNKRILLANRKVLKPFIFKIFQKEKKKLLQLNYIFCSDDFLLKINTLHLGHNYFTDIITFDLSELPNQIIGEIYISTDRVKENASLIGVTINEELHRVIIHGVLHLCGYKDKTAKQKKEMRLLENQYLQKYFK